MASKPRDGRGRSDSSSSSSDSRSDSDGSRNRKRSRSRRSESDRRRSSSSRRDDKKKKSKKSKKSKASSSKDADGRRRDRKRRHRDDDGAPDRVPAVDYQGAMRVVRALLGEFPEIAGDLLALLQMVDDGEVAVIGGIENRRVRAKLKELFPLLGLVKLREPKRAYAKSKEATGESLLEVFQRLLAGDEGVRDDRSAGHRPAVEADEADAEEDKAAVAPPPSGSSRRSAAIGPAMPPPGVLPESNHVQEDDDDDDVVGPALPGMKGFRLADERVEAEMARQAKALEQGQWDRARGVHKPVEPAGKPLLEREEWMTVMPDSSFLKESLGPTAKRQTGKPAAFRSKEPAAVDKTWFDSPEERERAKRAKLDIQLLGYVREENAPAIGPSVPSVTSGGPSTNESIMPSANPEADSNIRRQMEQLKQSRGPSLLEQHQRKVAEEAKARGGAASSKPTSWNRDRDLTARRGMSGDDADRIINASKQINSKFTAPTISRQFL